MDILRSDPEAAEPRGNERMPIGEMTSSRTSDIVETVLMDKLFICSPPVLAAVEQVGPEVEPRFAVVGEQAPI